MNILITSAGQRVSLVRAFRHELKELFPGARVFTVDMQPELSAACNVSDGYFTVPRVTDEAYIKRLLTICAENDIRMIIPTIDTELKVLSENIETFRNQGIHCIVSSPEFIIACRDKRIINEFFAKHNIEVPAEVNKDKPTYPLFIKPYDGSLSADTFLIMNPNELTEYHLTNPRMMFMEYLDKEHYDEFTVDMYYGKDHKVKCIIPRKRIHIRAGEINKGVTCRNRIVPYLLERIGYIEGAVGCLTTQLFAQKNGDRIVGIEINPRFGGGFPLSYRAGGNYPRWLIREYFLGEAIEYTDNWEDNLLMLRYDDEVLVHGYNS